MYAAAGGYGGALAYGGLAYGRGQGGHPYGGYGHGYGGYGHGHAIVHTDRVAHTVRKKPPQQRNRPSTNPPLTLPAIILETTPKPSRNPSISLSSRNSPASLLYHRRRRLLVPLI